MIKNNRLFQLTLDDGQVINDKLSNLTRTQIISIANQYRRNKQRAIADKLMRYQHEEIPFDPPYRG